MGKDTENGNGLYLPAGTLLQGGKYRIVRFIGSGGFGCTYEAEHTVFGDRVAIKEFFVRDFCNRDGESSRISVGTESKRSLVEKLLRKFKEEARSLYRLHHPGIVRVSDVFEENGTAYYVMDYIAGRSLQEIVKSDGPLPEERALKYIRQVCGALSYVHSHNRLHLDIKPGNIMVDGNDHAVLIDFGASKQYDEASGENTSTLMGRTPGYAPLEQMDNNVRTFTPATDIYALGATMYKCLSGETPPSSVSLAGGEELPPLPSSVSACTRRAVSVAMELNKGKRPQSISEFLSILDGGCEGEDSEETDITSVHKPVSSPKPEEPTSDSAKPGESGPKGSGRRRTLKWTVVSLCILAGLAAGMYVLRPLFQSGGVSATGQPDSTSVSGMVPDSLHQSVSYSDSVRRAEVINRKRDSIRRVEEELREREAAARREAAATEAAMKRMQDSIAEANRKQEAVRERERQEQAAREAALQRIQDSLSRMQAQAERDRQEREVAAQSGRGTENGHEWVDLGLSVKWATCNVGASSPSDYGSHYAWGETSPKRSYKEGNGKTYGVKMGDIGGDRNYDVARANWGGSWRLPTKEEMEELVFRCRWEWTSQGGRNGYRVTGPNGASIFLPAAGWRRGSSLNGAGVDGYYWASAPYGSDNQNACSLYFDSGLRCGLVAWDYRYYGLSVRPVKE